MAPDRGSHAVLEALRAFRRSPTSWNLIRREPRALFDNLREVISLAAGPQNRSASVTARAFLSVALLRPGASHYELLGLDKSAEPAAIKDRYRLLMRIAHPDFAADGTPWPADTAARLNLAYETLSVPQKRAKYDAERQAPPPPREVAPRPRPVRPPAAPSLRPQAWVRPRNELKYLAAVCGVLGAVSAVAWFGLVDGESDGIVQRAFEAAERPLLTISALKERTTETPPALAPVKVEKAPTVIKAGLAPSHASSTLEAEGTLSMQPPAVQALATVPQTPPAAGLSETRVAPPASVVAASATPPTQVIPAATPLAQIMAEAAGPATANDLPDLTMDDVQPLVAALVQAMESGQSARIEGLVLDRGPSFAHFMKEYERITAGARTRKVVRMNLDPTLQKGRLVLTGRMWFQSGYLLTRDVYMLAVQVEFVRNGNSIRLARLTYV